MKYFFLLLLIIPTFVLSQSWEKNFGLGFGFSVQQATDGGFVLTGTLLNETNYVFSLIKTNNYGDTLWTKTYEENLEGRGYSVQITNDGGYILLGATYDPFNPIPNIYLIKTNNVGDTLWTRKYFGLNGTSMQQTTDGGYVISGYKYVNTNQGNNALILKTDMYGDSLWTKTYDINNDDKGHSIQQTTSGGYIITGTTKPTNSNNDMFLINTDSNGNTNWSKVFGGYTQEQAFSVQNTNDGGYILAGYSNLYQGSSSGYEQTLLIKMNNLGDTLWTKHFDLHTHNHAYAIRQTSNGEYIMTGDINTTSFIQKIYLVKLNSTGDTLWTKTYGNGSPCEGRSIQETTDGGYILTGGENSATGIFTMVLIKTDGNGNTVFIRKLNPQNKKGKLLMIVDLLGREIRKPKKNTPYIEIYDDGTIKKKMITN